MRSSSRMWLLALSLAAAACGSGRGPATPVHSTERATEAGAEVSEDAFAGAVRDLLASPPGSRERQLRLQGVVARQMSRAASRFKTKDGDRALASIAGALYLVHAGELTSDVLGPDGASALRAASAEYAKRGDEGRARAMYEMLLRIAPPAEQADIKAHLDAIAAWVRDTGGEHPVQIAGARESAAVTRHLLEPSIEARDDAAAKTIDFVEQALALRATRRARGTPISREEGIEAVRALETGTTVLAAIYLRNADPDGALKALERESLREVTRPELVKAIEAAAEAPDSAKWLELARMIQPPRPSPGEEEQDFGRDGELLRAASFTAAVEAYRLDPLAPEPAAAVGAMLAELGMWEAAPVVLSDAVKAAKDPKFAGFALVLTMSALGRALGAEEPASVRRTFRASAPLLAAADAIKGTSPSPAKVYAMMSEIELRDGNLDEARKLAIAAEQREKTGSTLLVLARLDEHAQQAKSAAARLDEALTTEDVVKDPALRGEVLLLRGDIARDVGDVNGARATFTEALRDLAKARSATESEARARIERLVAQVLERFGADASAQKALERAIEAAPRNKRQAAATIGELVGHAFVKADLEGSREGLARGLAADLEDEDLVYYALWVRLLERQMKVASSGSERLLAQMSADPRWTGKLAAFGTGKLPAAELVRAAATPTQKTEALFYSAMEAKIAGDAKGSKELLEQVTASPGIELMEFRFAREMLRGPASPLGPVPDVGLP